MSSDPQYQYLKYSIKDSICTLFINREKSLNALSVGVIKELISFYQWADKKKNIAIIIMTGSGNRAFIAGADIKEMSTLDKTRAKSYSLRGQELTMIIQNSSKPVIAAINGYALGGGCEIALACHIRYACEDSIFGQPEVGLGLIAGFGGTQRLPRIVGKGIALELLLSGKSIVASEALRIGLVNRIIKKNKLLDECFELAKKINNNSPVAIKYTINSINRGESKNMDESLKIESSLFAKVFSTSDCKEGLKSFVDKKKPKFSGK